MASSSGAFRALGEQQEMSRAGGLGFDFFVSRRLDASVSELPSFWVVLFVMFRRV